MIHRITKTIIREIPSIDITPFLGRESKQPPPFLKKEL